MNTFILIYIYINTCSGKELSMCLHTRDTFRFV